MDLLIQVFHSHVKLVSDLILFFVYAASVVFFLNGLWAGWKGLRWMRRINPDVFSEKSKENIQPGDPLVLVVAKSFSASQKKYGKNPTQLSFLADATRKMAESVYERTYLEPLILSSNLLPPIGFIGTVFGMIMIFIAKVNQGSNELNTIGLGAALFTTLLALTLFVILEALKMVLSRMIKRRIEEALFFDYDGNNGEEGCDK